MNGKDKIKIVLAGNVRKLDDEDLNGFYRIK